MHQVKEPEKGLSRKMMSMNWDIELAEFEMLRAAKWRSCTNGENVSLKLQKIGQARGCGESLGK